MPRSAYRQRRGHWKYVDGVLLERVGGLNVKFTSEFGPFAPPYTYSVVCQSMSLEPATTSSYRPLTLFLTVGVSYSRSADMNVGHNEVNFQVQLDKVDVIHVQPTPRCVTVTFRIWTSARGDVSDKA